MFEEEEHVLLEKNLNLCDAIRNLIPQKLEDSQRLEDLSLQLQDSEERSLLKGAADANLHDANELSLFLTSYEKNLKDIHDVKKDNLQIREDLILKNKEILERNPVIMNKLLSNVMKDQNILVQKQKSLMERAITYLTRFEH